MMPVFNALAGLSPNWEAVLVQIEHCADRSTGDRKNRSNNTIKIKLPLAITIQLPCKITQKNFDFTSLEISNPISVVNNHLQQDFSKGWHVHLQAGHKECTSLQLLR
jgi:hypothetical protein